MCGGVTRRSIPKNIDCGQTVAIRCWTGHLGIQVHEYPYVLCVCVCVQVPQLVRGWGMIAVTGSSMHSTTHLFYDLLRCVCVGVLGCVVIIA